jgi:hypothetical protein
MGDSMMEPFERTALIIASLSLVLCLVALLEAVSH